MPDSTPEQAEYDVAVIGAGPAGTTAALRAAELGARVVVLEAARVGGTCVNTGCVPTRVLAKTARMMRETRSAGDYGIDVGTPTLDWAATAHHVHERVDLVRSIKREEQRFEAAGVNLFHEGRARFVDEGTLLLDSGRRVRARSILICVGGHSRRLPIPGAELATVPENVLGLTELPRRVAVIGGGNTGAQLVTVFNVFGSEVTLLDVAARILMTSDSSISDACRRRLRAPGRARAHRDRDGLGARAAGRRGARDPVARERGVAHGRGRRGDHGHRLARRRRGSGVRERGARREPAHPPFLLPAGGFTGPDFAGVGFTQEQARERDPQCVVAPVPISHLDRAVIDHRESGFLTLIADRRRELLLGAHRSARTRSRSSSR
ncbi:FAD-dependent oxidoreductase [Rathayibacter rathayi]|uniref:FAD-dependent oxidoreductase n=1 Tax=Rathayibacter rathayi TaxID=33887 RepID=UPI000BCD9213|nr:FAD-dependent oxidoreductase [Rathayibacter rathayi]TWD68577.1 glutathione reductase (NADPH) [Rathayibacter rathayi]SOE04710.1 glutathione reductase (NADPH) [Rathayibacter rathayi NCPPB 2980 = VKM Ac-1601]